MARRRPEGRAAPGRPARRGGGERGRLLSPPPGRPPLRAVLFDVDGTITKPRSSWRHVHERLGLWSGRAERHQERFRAGEISYEEFCRLDAEDWRGLPVARLRRICDAIPYHEGAPALIASLKEAGLVVGIVSTGLSLLADRVRDELGLDHALSNDLIASGGLVAGQVRIAVAHGGKDLALRDFCAEFRLDPGGVAAVGDSEGDVSMFRAAGWSVAFNAESAEVRREARATVPGTDLRRLVPLLVA